MELNYLFFTGIAVIIVGVFLFKMKKNSYSKKSIEILIENFGDKDFSQNITILQLEEKLEIEVNFVSIHKKSIAKIITDAKHKSDIIYKHNMSANKPYTDLTTFRIVANCVIDYCAKKDMNIKDSINILFLTFEKPDFQEAFNITKSETEIINNFYALLEGFVFRYTKAIE